MTQAHTRDFSKKRLPVFFTIDGRRYDCFKALDLDQLTRFAALTKNLGDISKTLTSGDADDVEVVEVDADEAVESTSVAINKISGLMKIVMKKASFATFMTYLQPTEDEREDDDFEPIDYTQLLDVVKWLMEVYTGRPTKPSSDSSTGSESDDGGTSSTAGASPEELEPLSLTSETS